jgi:phospholipid/cholesterol/gamma-HCH transport system ATP-binding protein
MRIRDLNKSFGPRHILRGIDLDIYRGETLVIIGGSGSGKTTLIRHIMGMLRSDAGAVIGRRSQPQPRHPGAARDLPAPPGRGVPERRAAQFAHRARERRVAAGRGRPPAGPDEVRTRVVTALKQVFLPAEEILALKPASLSGGMRKRVGIARAIIQKPEIILYDEPTTGLDPVTVNGVNELTVALQKSLGVTSIVITHDMHAAFDDRRPHRHALQGALDRGRR